jgi:predicted AAA+ superfamily ATPase
MADLVQRVLLDSIERWLFRRKVLILFGARQVGKTTLVKHLLKKYGAKDAYYNCELPSVRELLRNEEPSVLGREFGERGLVVLDEAQYIPNIGQKLKILVDHLPDLQVIATGSSSFELAEQTGEPLVGRALTFTLFPFSYEELLQRYRPTELKQHLDKLLLYGSYPEVFLANSEDAKLLLKDLTNRYLYKDILKFEQIRKSELLQKLLQLLAFQVGSEVSYHELANTLKINERTVARYIDLLEKAFVIFRLAPFSRNLRKEITKKQKIYFFDLGIRNSLINQFQPLDIRPDRGAIWENFLILERKKYLSSKLQYPNAYFWRTHDQQELDYLEDKDGHLSGYELKWKAKKKRKPIAFEKAYPTATIDWVDRESFPSFISDQ